MAQRKKKRTTPARPPRPPAPDTKEQAARYSMMRTKGVTQQKIAETLGERGVDVSRQTVNSVIRNRFVNEDVIAVFCEMTDTTRADAWPDVPPIGTEAAPDPSVVSAPAGTPE